MFHRRFAIWIVIGLANLLSVVSSHGDDGLVLYTTQIKALLKERCYACHGALKQQAGLRLDTGEFIRRGSESGSIVKSGPDEQAVLLERVSAADDSLRMPPIGKPLTSVQIQWLTQWIATGAATPAGEEPEADPAEHWAFQPPEKAVVPISETRPDWGANPIDAFLSDAYDPLRLTPAPDARPAVLLRRIHLDLTGLPPTPEQVRDFLRDPSEQAYQAVVDRLLQSPQYGERWARHWMDIWRYSDWYGRRQQNDVRNSAPQIWRWRDWIVNSLNEDKSYAQMVREMLAADELSADDDTTWPATGYLIRSYYSLNPNEWMRHNVEYTAKSFLALTFNCAHCHDHKYDPIAHDDYFRMRAFFEPMGIRQDRVTGEPEPPPFEPYKYGGSRKVVRLGMVRIYDAQPDAPTWFYTSGDERNRVEQRGSIPPGVPSFLQTPMPDIEPVQLPTEGWNPGARAPIQQAVLHDRQADLQEAQKQLASVAPAQDIEDQEKDLLARIEKAEAQRTSAIEQARAANRPAALAGQQSLLLSAETGRRVAHHPLTGLQAVPDGTTISFRLRILKDGHINFQLAKDTTKHLTALYLGFVGGEIRSYRPGGFQNLVAGVYDFEKGQTDFRVQLVLHPASDTADLTVELAGGSEAGEREAIVEGTPIALNGWNAAKKPHQPLTLDCRTGTRVLVDDVAVSAGEQSFLWDFEPPTFLDGQDVSGIDGWTIYDTIGRREISHTVADVELIAPYSVVTATAGDAKAWDADRELRLAKAALEDKSLERTAAELAVEAARKKLQAVEAVIAADRASHQQPDRPQTLALARQAKQAQVDAARTSARARVLQLRQQHQTTLALPDSNKNKAKQLATLSQELQTAKQQWGKLQSEGNQRDEPGADYQRLSPTTSRVSTGRRRALALWITDRRNPLTARVAVNHIWARHFHQPLAPSVYDFGRNGKSPTHPKLLDWLAVELTENNWSMKHLHRLIVTSRAYRMSSSGNLAETNLQHDKDNRMLWRMNLGRMESEVVRDSILAIAGNLDGARGGPPLLNTQAMSTYRRSLYYEIFPEAGGVNALGEIFDPPDPNECFRRTSTIVPQQALALSNSELIHTASKTVAADLAESDPSTGPHRSRLRWRPDPSTGADQSEETFVQAAFLRVLARLPSAKEAEVTARFLAKQQKLVSPAAAREGLIRVLFNHNDFVSVR